jgi:hypothetical protein
MSANLRPKTKAHSSVRDPLQVPRGLRNRIRRARVRHGDSRPYEQRCRRLGREAERQERVPSGLAAPKSNHADRLGLSRRGRDALGA